MAKKYASLDSLATFLNNLKTVFAPLSHSHKIEEMTDYVIDDSMSDTSVNPVQNKVVNDAIVNLGETVTEQIKTATADAFMVEGGATATTLADIFGEPPYVVEFTDETEELSNVTVASGSDYSTYRLRNVAIVSEIPTTMNDGDIALVIRQEE